MTLLQMRYFRVGGRLFLWGGFAVRLRYFSFTSS